jgi:hypothetical protein
MGEIFIPQFLSCVYNYIEDMATITALAKIYSTKFNLSVIQKVAELGEILSLAIKL